MSGARRLLLVAAVLGGAARGEAKTMLFGRDIHGTAVPSTVYEALVREQRLAALDATPEAPTIDRGEVSLSVVVTNPSASPAELYVVRTLARAQAQFLSVHLMGLDQLVEPDGPESYAVIGQLEAQKVVLPAGGVVRFTRSLALADYEYEGVPVATLDWRMLLNGRPLGGQVKVTLPRAESLVPAVRRGHLDEMKRLIASGADLKERDRFGNSLLMVAIQADRDEAAALLVNRGATVEGYLFEAAARGRVKIVELLLAHGARVDAVDDQGQTPLYWAATNGQAEVAAILIRHGAALDVKNKWGHSPIEIAKEELKVRMRQVAGERRK